MKFPGLLIVFVLIISSTITSSISAKEISSNLPIEITKDTGILQPVQNIIFSRLKRNTIFTQSNEKYAEEIAYYFHKNGFQNIPVGYVLFENGDIVTLNTTWETNQFNSNLEGGSLFVLMIYEASFSVSNFQSALTTLSTNLTRKISTLSITDIQKITAKKFVIQNSGNQKQIIFSDDVYSQEVQGYFRNIDFKTKVKPQVKVKLNSIAYEGLPEEVITIPLAISNSSSSPLILGPTNKLQVLFKSGSQLYVDNAWNDVKAPIILASGYLKSQEEKLYTISVKLPPAAGDLNDEISVRVGDSVFSTEKLKITTKDIGQKVLKIKNLGLNYLPVKKEPIASTVEIGKVASGEVYMYTETKNGFYRISYKGNEGWVSAGYVQLIKN